MLNSFYQYSVWIFLLVGFGLGLLLSLVLKYRTVDGFLHIDTRNPDKDKYNFIVLTPLDDLQNKKFILVQVKKR